MSTSELQKLTRDLVAEGHSLVNVEYALISAGITGVIQDKTLLSSPHPRTLVRAA